MKSSNINLSQGQAVDATSSCGPIDGDFDMEVVSSGNTKPVLAWEIDTTDFDAVLTRKTRTSKCGGHHELVSRSVSGLGTIVTS